MHNSEIHTPDSLNIEILHKPIFAKEQHPRYKSVCQQISMGLIVSLCGVIFGYGLTEISTIPILTLTHEYDITLRPSGAQSLLIGLMPAGGTVGALLNTFVLKHLRRRSSIFIICILMTVSIVMMQLTTPYTLFIGRFIEGIAIGFYVSIGAIYLREIAAREIRSQICAMFSLGKVFGIVLAYSLQRILLAAQFAHSWRLLLAFNGIIAVIQAFFIFFFVPNSPVQMVEKNCLELAKASVERMYLPEYVDEIMQELQNDDAAEKAKAKHDEENGGVFEGVDYSQNIKKATLIATHVILLRQFIGGNCLVTFSGQIVDVFNKKIGSYTALVINIIQLIGNTIAVFFITKRIGRRPLLLFGTAFLMISNFAIAIVLSIQEEYLIFIFMALYMAAYGLTFLPSGWAYPSEIMPANKSVLPNAAGWIATAFVTSVPPIVVGAMPDHNAYPLFIFFGVYGIFGFTILFIHMVESRNKTYEEIIKQY